jgi:hypothetical protein
MSVANYSYTLGLLTGLGAAGIGALYYWWASRPIRKAKNRAYYGK